MREFSVADMQTFVTNMQQLAEDVEIETVRFSTSFNGEPSATFTEDEGTQVQVVLKATNVYEAIRLPRGKSKTFSSVAEILNDTDICLGLCPY